MCHVTYRRWRPRSQRCIYNHLKRHFQQATTSWKDKRCTCWRMLRWKPPKMFQLNSQDRQLMLNLLGTCLENTAHTCPHPRWRPRSQRCIYNHLKRHFQQDVGEYFPPKHDVQVPTVAPTAAEYVPAMQLVHAPAIFAHEPD